MPPLRTLLTDIAGAALFGLFLAAMMTGPTLWLDAIARML